MISRQGDRSLTAGANTQPEGRAEIGPSAICAEALSEARALLAMRPTNEEECVVEARARLTEGAALISDRRCGTCRHWPARLDRRGRRIYAGDPMLDCEASILRIDELNLPASIVLRWPPPRIGMDMNDGKDCPRWTFWKDETA